MSTPTWILEIFAAIMILIAEVSAAQLLLARAWTRPGRPGADIALSQLLTAIALAGVLVPGLAALPTAVWVSIFAVLTAWFAWSLRQDTHAPTPALARTSALTRAPHTPYLLHCAAMLYILAAAPTTSPAVSSPAVSSSATAAMPGMTTPATGSSASGSPPHAGTLALILALLLIACTVRALDQPASGLVPGRRPLLATAPPAPAAYPGALLLLSSAATKACQVTLSLTMALILIIT